MSQVRLVNLNKRFDQVIAVEDLSLDITQGDFVSLLGPSGCGKTTTLRMLAGFEFPESGQIYFDDRDVTFLKANLRNTGMVFQNFALFPHMTVFENIAFGLRARKVSKSNIELKVREALDLVNMRELGNRKVTEISGGQQQRVALARAIVIEPNILLLDEPLSNLDAQLREEMRFELRALQQRLAITTIYVTHDQEEALALSDRIAVMQHGICHQYGSPEEIYYRPANAFVAQFVGNANILNATLVQAVSGQRLQLADDWFLPSLAEAGGFPEGEPLTVGLRPEGIEISDTKVGEDQKTGILKSMRLSGSLVEYEIVIGDILIQSKNLATASDFKRKAGMSVYISVQPSHILLLPGH